MTAPRFAAQDSCHRHPETRPSLLARVKRLDDDKSWKQFFEIYSPVIFRYSRRKGLQDADAWEVTQEVLLQIMKYISSFSYDPNQGKFRCWLSRVIHSRLVRHWKGQSETIDAIEFRDELDDVAGDPLLDQLVVQELNQLALAKIRPMFAFETWQAFEMVWQQRQSAESAAAALGKSVGWVYVCKSRVLKKLSEHLRILAEEFLY